MNNNQSLGIPAVDIKGLTKTYKVGFWIKRSVKALQDLTLQIPTGQVYGILGPNGAGKSTTIKILMNLVQATGGSTSIFGQPVDSAKVRRDIGFLPENPNPYEYLTGREFVILAGQLHGLSGAELHKRADEVLSLVELGQAQKLQIRRYSKGMVQRVALAQALVNKPKLLVLDEPTSGLDPLGRRMMRDIILAERERGTTILFCTHIIPDVESLCDRIAVIVGGKLVKEGSVSQLVYSTASSVELTIEGIASERLKETGIPIENTQALEGRLVVQVADGDSQPMLAKVLALGGKVKTFQPVKFSLEDLFLQTITQAGARRVGGEIS